MALLILCAPVWARSSRFSQTSAPQRSERRGANVSAVGRPTQPRSSARLAVQVLPHARLEPLEGGHERFRNVTSAERPEAAALVGQGSGNRGIEQGARLAGLQFRFHRLFIL
jgi:hypothetical protein